MRSAICGEVTRPTPNTGTSTSARIAAASGMNRPCGAGVGAQWRERPVCVTLVCAITLT